MKVRIEKPDGHMLQVEGRVKDVATLLNAWWAGTEEEQLPPVPKAKARMGFQIEEDTDEHSSID